MNVPTLAELTAKGESPEILFWVGCAGSFDDRYKRVTKAFVNLVYWVLKNPAQVIRPAGQAMSFCFRCRP